MPELFAHNLVTYDFRELHKKLELKIVKSEAAQNSQRPKSGRSKL
jgi:hypothetical protein